MKGQKAQILKKRILATIIAGIRIDLRVVIGRGISQLVEPNKTIQAKTGNLPERGTLEVILRIGGLVRTSTGQESDQMIGIAVPLIIGRESDQMIGIVGPLMGTDPFLEEDLVIRPPTGGIHETTLEIIARIGGKTKVTEKTEEIALIVAEIATLLEIAPTMIAEILVGTGPSKQNALCIRISRYQNFIRI